VPDHAGRGEQGVALHRFIGEVETGNPVNLDPGPCVGLWRAPPGSPGLQRSRSRPVTMIPTLSRETTDSRDPSRERAVQSLDARFHPEPADLLARIHDGATTVMQRHIRRRRFERPDATLSVYRSAGVLHATRPRPLLRQDSVPALPGPFPVAAWSTRRRLPGTDAMSTEFVVFTPRGVFRPRSSSRCRQLAPIASRVPAPPRGCGGPARRTAGDRGTIPGKRRRGILSLARRRMSSSESPCHHSSTRQLREPDENRRGRSRRPFRPAGKR